MAQKSLGDRFKDGLLRIRNKGSGGFDDDLAADEPLRTSEIEAFVNRTPEEELSEYHERVTFTKHLTRLFLVEYAFRNSHQPKSEKRYTEQDSNVLAMKALEQMDSGELVVLPIDALRLPLPNNDLPIISTLTIAESTLLQVAQRHGDIANDFDPQNVDTEPRREFLKKFYYKLPIGLGESPAYIHFVGIIPNFYNSSLQMLWQNKDNIQTFRDIVQILYANGHTDHDIHLLAKSIFTQTVYAAAHFILRGDSEGHIATQVEVNDIIRTLLINNRT